MCVPKELKPYYLKGVGLELYMSQGEHIKVSIELGQNVNLKRVELSKHIVYSL